MDPDAEEGATVRVPLTSDKNGEVHLWLPTNYDGTSVSFFSANSSKTIAHPKIEENDENKAPIAVRVFRGCLLYTSLPYPHALWSSSDFVVALGL